MRTLVSAVVVFAGLFSMGGRTCMADYAPRVGQPHPDFTLPKLGDRSPVSLSQFRGRKVLLIHFASW